MVALERTFVGLSQHGVRLVQPPSRGLAMAEGHQRSCLQSLEVRLMRLVSVETIFLMASSKLYDSD
jgi:hypothetical protein